MYVPLYILINTGLGIGDIGTDKTIKNGVAYLGAEKDPK